MRAPIPRLALLATSLLVSAASLSAQVPRSEQDSLRARSGGWLVGGSVGVPRYEGAAVPELFTIGMNWTQLTPGRLGADFSLMVVPRVLAHGFLAGGARGGVALPLALSPSVLVLPSGGVSVLGGVGAGGGGGTTGINAGVAAVLLGAGSVGVRGGVTWHRIRGTESALWLWELGLVHAPRSR